MYPNQQRKQGAKGHVKNAGKNNREKCGSKRFVTPHCGKTFFYVFQYMDFPGALGNIRYGNRQKAPDSKNR